MGLSGLRSLTVAASLVALTSCADPQQETDDKAPVETVDDGRWDTNKAVTDALFRRLQECSDEDWNAVIMCQGTEEKCLEAGNSAQVCEGVVDGCESTADDLAKACQDDVRDIAGCDFGVGVDSDGDGLLDEIETTETGTNPCAKNSCGSTPDGGLDSDGDGLPNSSDPNAFCPEYTQHCGFPAKGYPDSACK